MLLSLLYRVLETFKPLPVIQCTRWLMVTNQKVTNVIYVARLTTRHLNIDTKILYATSATKQDTWLRCVKVRKVFL